MRDTDLAELNFNRGRESILDDVRRAIVTRGRVATNDGSD